MCCSRAAVLVVPRARADGTALPPAPAGVPRREPRPARVLAAAGAADHAGDGPARARLRAGAGARGVRRRGPRRHRAAGRRPRRTSTELLAITDLDALAGPVPADTGPLLKVLLRHALLREYAEAAARLLDAPATPLTQLLRDAELCDLVPDQPPDTDLAVAARPGGSGDDGDRARAARPGRRPARHAS